MQKYLFRGTYTAEGIKGVVKDGGTGRKAAVQALAESVGGKMESMYFAFGSDDFFVVADLPDAESAVAVAAAAGSSGAVSLTTVVLLTPEQVCQLPPTRRLSRTAEPRWALRWGAAARTESSLCPCKWEVACVGPCGIG